MKQIKIVADVCTHTFSMASRKQQGCIPLLIKDSVLGSVKTSGYGNYCEIRDEETARNRASSNTG